MRLIPNAKVGHIGLYRDPGTLEPVEYYCKLPKDIEERDVMIVDPMLATGGSSCGHKHRERLRWEEDLSDMSISAPEGLNVVRSSHPDVDSFTAAIDDHLTSMVTSSLAWVMPAIVFSGRGKIWYVFLESLIFGLFAIMWLRLRGFRNFLGAIASSTLRAARGKFTKERCREVGV